MSDNEINQEQVHDSTELARKAVNAALARIRDNPDIRYHMGLATQTYEDLKAAHSALNGISHDAIDEATFIKLKRKSAAEKLSDIRDLADRCTCTTCRKIADLCRE